MLKEPKTLEQFKQDSEFLTAFRLYQFDSDFRAITFQVIEIIEIAVRTQLIYHLSHKNKSGFWYQNSDAFKDYPAFISMLQKITKSTSDSTQEFIVKYKKTYNQFLPPSWKSFELLTFNSLLSILKNLKNPKDIIPISQSFGLNHEVFLSWLETLVYVRNICAHHSRLWNIKLTISPKWVKSPKVGWVNRWDNDEVNKNSNDKVLKIYAVVCILIYFIKHINPYHNYPGKLLKLLDKYNQVDTMHMGFPKDWKRQSLWQKKD